MSDIGSLAKAVTTLIAAAAAIGEGFRPRSGWEPCEQELPTILQKIASLISTVGIAILFYIFAKADQEQSNNLIHVALEFLGVCITSFLVYIVLHSTCMFESSDSKKLIGGFRFTENARDLKAQGYSRGEILKKCAYNKEHIWTPASCIVSKLLFVIAYLSLVSSGALALATSGFLVSTSKKIDVKVKVLWEEEPAPTCDAFLTFDFGYDQISIDTIVGQEKRFQLPRAHENEEATLRATCGRLGKSDDLKMVVANDANETVMLKKVNAWETSKLISDGYSALSSREDGYITAYENAQQVLRQFPNDAEATRLESAARNSRSLMHQF